MANMPICEGEITNTLTGLARCSSGWFQQPAVAPFDVSQIDPQVATAMFGAGFLLLITPWAAAWGFSQLIKLLR